MQNESLWTFLVSRSWGFLALFLSIGIVVSLDRIFFERSAINFNHGSPIATAAAEPSVSKFQLAQLDELRDAIVNKTHTSNLSSWERFESNGTSYIKVRITDGDTTHFVTLFPGATQSLHYSFTLGKDSNQRLTIVDDGIDGIVDVAEYSSTPTPQQFDRYQSLGLEYRQEYQELYEQRIHQVARLLGL